MVSLLQISLTFTALLFVSNLCKEQDIPLWGAVIMQVRNPSKNFRWEHFFPVCCIHMLTRTYLSAFCIVHFFIVCFARYAYKFWNVGDRASLTHPYHCADSFDSWDRKVSRILSLHFRESTCQNVSCMLLDILWALLFIVFVLMAPTMLIDHPNHGKYLTLTIFHVRLLKLLGFGEPKNLVGEKAPSLSGLVYLKVMPAFFVCIACTMMNFSSSSNLKNALACVQRISIHKKVEIYLLIRLHKVFSLILNLFSCSVVEGSNVNPFCETMIFVYFCRKSAEMLFFARLCKHARCFVN